MSRTAGRKMRRLSGKLKRKNFANNEFSKINLLAFAVIFASLGLKLLFFSQAAGGSNGLGGSDPTFFPIAVWAQTYSAGTVTVNGVQSTVAQAYSNMGVNIFNNGDYDVSASFTNPLAAAGNLSVIASDQATGLASSYAPHFVAWDQMDEPDNAQPNGSGGYGPCVDPSVIDAQYNTFKAGDPTRPVFINFGQGVSQTNYIGRGSNCAGQTQMYAQYAAGADILSFDIYPVNNNQPIDYVAQGVTHLLGWTNHSKPVWAFIETTPYNSGDPAPNPVQVKAEIWQAIDAGATGISYFCHILSGANTSEHGLLLEPAMVSALTADDAQIKSLAPEINSPTIANGATVSSSATIDQMVKQYNGSTYLFAVSDSSNTANATFTVAGGINGTATVLGESRTIPVVNGSFTDSFAGDAVHLYQISASGSTTTGDINGDGHVTVADLSLLLSSYGSPNSICVTAPQYTCDLNGSGGVTIIDLSILLSHFGA